MGSIKNVLSEAIEGNEDYHVLVSSKLTNQKLCNNKFMWCFQKIIC